MHGRTVELPAAAAALLALALGGCRQQLPSTWLDRQITIDGKNPDWAGAEAYYSEEQGVKVGLANDDRYLYVYLATWHRQLERQILMNGLTVWFDAGGGKKKTFGIEYPLRKKMAPSDFLLGQRGSTGDALNDLLRGARSILSVIRPAEGEPLTLAMPDSGGLGIEAMIDIVNRTLVYELKVPLTQLAEAGAAINTAPGRTIGIGFVVGTREMPSRGADEGQRPTGMGEPGGDEGGGPPGGMGGFPGGGGGRGGGGMGGMGGRGGMPGGVTEEAFELWANVALALKP